MATAKRKLKPVPERAEGPQRFTTDAELSALIDATEALDRVEALWSEDRDADWSRTVGWLRSRHESLFDRAQMIRDGDA